MMYSGSASDGTVSVSTFTGERTALFDFDYNSVSVVYRKAAAPSGKSAGGRSVKGKIFVNIIVTVAEAVAYSVGITSAQHFRVIKAFERFNFTIGGKSRYAAHIGDL